MPKAPEIEFRENGPIIVKHADGIERADGAEVELKEVMALCRCGHSGNKPFCDGSHKRVGFSGTSDKPPEGPDRVIRYQGAEVTVVYNPQICSHAAECVRLVPECFDPDQRPWINPDKGGEDRVRDAVRSCPSGALRVADESEKSASHLIPDRPTVVVQKDGPYWITGATVDETTPGEGGTVEKYVLCRCGLSGNKPYCDGSHRDAGWSDQS